MGSYITASYKVKCKWEEAFRILSYIEKVNGMYNFSFERKKIGDKGVLKVSAWARRLGTTDRYDEINLCRKLTREYPNTRIWLHVCYETGNYEFSDYLFSDGGIEGGFTYDDERYKKYSCEFREIEEEGVIEEAKDATEVSENHPCSRIKREFYKIQEGDILYDRTGIYKTL